MRGAIAYEREQVAHLPKHERDWVVTAALTGVSLLVLRQIIGLNTYANLTAEQIQHVLPLPLPLLNITGSSLLIFSLYKKNVTYWLAYTPLVISIAYAVTTLLLRSGAIGSHWLQWLDPYDWQACAYGGLNC